MGKKPRSNLPAVLIHDGSQWILPGEPMLKYPGRIEELPEALLEALAEVTTRIRVLLAGEVRRLDIALPAKVRWADAQALIARESADVTGADPAGLLCAGKGYGGKRDGAILAGVFDRSRIETLHEVVADADFAFAGVGSLELALLAAWRARPTSATQALVIVGQTSTVVVPPKGGGGATTATAQVVSGGLRHLTLDGPAWVGRFTHGARFLNTSVPLRVMTLGDSAEDVAELLRTSGGFTEAQTLSAETLLSEAAHLAVSVKSNRLNTVLPIVNPYVPRKRFSHAWIVVPSVALLALPLLWGVCEDLRLKHATKVYNDSAAQYLPLEKAFKEAQRQKSAAQKAVEDAKATQKAQIERKKPLAAMVHMTYFFSKYAGASVILESLEQVGDTIVARGIAKDSEDLPRLEAALKAFTDKEGLRIQKISTGEAKDNEGARIFTFEDIIDFSALGGK